MEIKQMKEEANSFISEMEYCIMKNDWEGIKKLVKELKLLMHTDPNKHRLIMSQIKHFPEIQLPTDGLSEVEFTERERLLELQHNSTRWFSQQEFDRLKELSDKMFANLGSPHSK